MAEILPITKLSDLGLEIIERREEFVDSFEATVRIKVAWENRFEVIGSLMGGPDNLGRIQLPVQYDVEKPTGAADDVFAVCLGTSNEILGGLTDTTVAVAEPEFATIDCEFGDPGWRVREVGGVTFVMSEDFDASAEFLTLSSKGLFWDDPRLPDAEPLEPESAPAKLIPMAVWSVTSFFILPDELNAANQFQALNGSVNSKALFSPEFNLVFPRETLMFEQPIIEKHNTPLGEYRNVTFNLKWRVTDDIIDQAVSVASGATAGILESDIPQGWNAFFRPGPVLPRPIWTNINVRRDIPTGEPIPKLIRPYTPKDWDNWLPLKVTPKP